MIALWVLMCGIYSAFLMFVLYCTSFSENEALQLASFARYMNTFSVAAVLVLFMVLLDMRCFKHTIWVAPVLVMTFIVIIHENPALLQQVLPGKIAKDDKHLERFDILAEQIDCRVKTDETVLLVHQGDDGLVSMGVGYLVSPRQLDWQNYNDSLIDSNISSSNMLDKFITSADQYDWIIFGSVDEQSAKVLRDAFQENISFEYGGIYQVNGVDSKSGKLSVK